MLEERRIADLHGTEHQIYRRRPLGFLGPLSAAYGCLDGKFLRLGGFRNMKITKRFLPYTMAKGLQPPITFLCLSLCLYLKMPVVWGIFVRQFLVFARKS